MAKNRLNFEAHLSRHPHPISGGYASSLTPGPIVPQYFDILQPGDTIYFEPSMFVRMQDIVTAFFGEIDVHLDAFFVPLQMLYTPFGSVFMKTDDIMTSTLHDLTEISPDGFPLFNSKAAVTNNNTGLNLSTHRYSGAEAKGKEFARLLDALDMNPFILFTQENCEASGFEFDQMHSVDVTVCQSPLITPWIPCAYQAIYQKFYRNEEFERFDVRDYNFDRYYDQVTSSTSFNDPNILQLRYHQRLSDYFTDLRVSPIASAVNQLNGHDSPQFPDNGDVVDSLFYKVDSFLRSRNTSFDGQQNNDLLGYPASSSFNNTSINSKSELEDGDGDSFGYLNTANIRSLFALDKFLRVWGRAGKTYDDQILAHFGVKIPHDVKHDITHIKHWQASLTADPIYSTANIPLGRTVSSDDPILVSSLGQVGAQSQCTVGGSSEKFRAPVHGVFMVVAYALTKPIYEGTFSKLHLLTNRLSFPIPEFDKLGAQPLYAFEFDRQGLQTDEIDARVGWQNRYEQFKRKYNRCSFTYSVANLNGHVPGVSNVFAPWILSREAFHGYRRNQLISGLDLFEPVNALNNVMVTSYDGNMSADYWNTPHLMFQTDPLVTNFYANVKKVSWMSETGEPDL